MAEPVPGISATPDDNNARYFHVVVAGPSEVSNYISDVTFLFFYLQLIGSVFIINFKNLATAFHVLSTHTHNRFCWILFSLACFSLLAFSIIDQILCMKKYSFMVNVLG